MARPKEFDVDEALERAVDVFWAQGFAATSMQDLVEGMGINRGSLYGTFGGKDELYARALERYARGEGMKLSAVLDAEGPLVDRLRRYLLDLVANPDGRGCFLVNTACERSFLSDDSRVAVAGAVDATRGALLAALRSASAAGELVQGVAPEVAAETVLTLMQGLQVRTKTGAGTAALAPVIDHALAAIFA